MEIELAEGVASKLGLVTGKPLSWACRMNRAYSTGLLDALNGVQNQALKYEFSGCYEQGFNHGLNKLVKGQVA